jgi:hypothetical protein
MPSSLTFRTVDNTRWGAGNGSNLSADQIDLNFWTLFSAVQALEDHPDSGVGIDYIVVPPGTDLMYIHLTDHRVLGPFILPAAAAWRPRGEWQAGINYAAFDVVSYNGALYLVNVNHVSTDPFSILSTDGLGHDLYVLLLAEPQNALPDDGTAGQRLVKSSGSPFKTEFVSDLIRLSVTVVGSPNPGEMLFQYPVVDNMTLPEGLIGSVAFAGVPTLTDVSYDILLNGAPIGSIDFFGPSPLSVSVTFASDIFLVPGDVVTLNAPQTPDSQQADISFTIVATLTL